MRERPHAPDKEVELEKAADLSPRLRRKTNGHIDLPATYPLGNHCPMPQI